MFSWRRKFLIIFLVFIVFISFASVFMIHNGGVLCPASLSQSGGCLNEGDASFGLHHLSAARDMSEIPLPFLFYGFLLIFALFFFFGRLKKARISSPGGFPSVRAAVLVRKSGSLCLTRFWRWLAVACRLLPERPDLLSARYALPVF